MTSSQLHAAVRKNDLKQLRSLLRVGACIDAVDETGSTALHTAARHGRAAAAHELLCYDPDLSIRNVDGWTSAEVAWRRAQEEKAQPSRRSQEFDEVAIMLQHLSDGLQLVCMLPDSDEEEDDCGAGILWVLRRPTGTGSTDASTASSEGPANEIEYEPLSAK